MVIHLTEKQQETLNFIAEFLLKKQYAPSLAEIRESLGLGKNSNNVVIGRLKRLTEYELVKKERSIARSLRLTALGWKLVTIKLNEPAIFNNSYEQFYNNTIVSNSSLVQDLETKEKYGKN